MPETEDQRRAVVLEFYNLAQLPGIIGAVDCTHIKIQSPGGENAEVFRNRKSYFSINTQIIGSFDLKIMDIVARWPGSVHDTTIFNDSNIRGRFENNKFSPYCLVGDGGYPCRVYLLTPLQDPQTLPQQRYNNAQIKTRNPVERLFGVCKRRFPCLSLGMRLKLETMCEVIVATAVLHNMCLEQNDTIDFFENGPEMEQIEEIQVRIGYQNTATRDSIISAIFTLP
ncbi:unnamed protein product [Acanthoscelides obtectus]|uniref:DDE Tnp4 domain-containing protein n=1 Tax=Acanthoscelides obtectus TaxID=200917 RepID=A0A9P0LQY7_ACAOB|nr:unnamed protein product [Acanthoscelides obtectus]CAK1681167.1 Putative nuclease HARBI1 [Acanthoscelides obtectus]